MHEGMMEKAHELGRLIGQTQEYKTLQRAREGLSGDRDATAVMTRLGELEAEISRALQSGEEPSEATQVAYEEAFGKLQSSSLYQALVAAQANFEKVLGRVNEEIGKGMDAGSQSRIILPS